jgi:hypothetical protein
LDVFAEPSGAASTGKYPRQTETVALPEAFWTDLKQILGLLTRSRLAELTFYYTADRLKPLITQVRALVDSKGGNWKPEILAGVRYSLANALVVEGLWSDENEPLLESVELYRKVLERWTRKHWALSWATTQLNLRLVLGILGKQEASSAPLDEIVHLYRELLNGCIRERDRSIGLPPKRTSALL